MHPFLHSYKHIHFAFFSDTDRARKHGMEEFIAADPVTADHHSLFRNLQKWSLDWRLKDPFASLVNINEIGLSQNALTPFF